MFRDRYGQDDPANPRQLLGHLRDCADRSGASFGLFVPSVGGPDLPDEATQDDDGVGQGDEGLEHAGAAFGTDQQFAKAPVVPGVGTFDDPAGAGLQGSALGGDAPLAAQDGQPFAGLVRVVAGVQVHRDVLW